MFKVACPSCGAQVQYRSSASVMAVCQYCQSTLLRDADSVRDIGKMSNVLEDYSRIQIGTSGIWDALATEAQDGTPVRSGSALGFAVVGRIQLQYEDGMWNEWYVLFDDGTGGWLSDASGQCTFTLSLGKRNDTPAFDQVSIGTTYRYNNQTFYASDIRTAQCIGGQGELPFSVGQGWQARVVDFRSGKKFITLDYSEGDIPEVFYGTATSLEALKCQLLREEARIIESAGKLQGTSASLECPSCGSSIAYRAGLAEHLVCPTCHSEVAAKAGQAEVLAMHARLEQIAPTFLMLGDKAKIRGLHWELIGLMECMESGNGESSTWVEHLLYNPQRGFSWLVESMDGWDYIEVLNEWPEQSGNSCKIRGKVFRHLYTYNSTVTYAAGAFNWRVKIGDTTVINDFGKDNAKLTSETSAAEQSWSLSERVSEATVAQWFGKELDTVTDGPPELSSLTTIRILFLTILILINGLLWLASGFDMGVLVKTFIGGYLLWQGGSWFSGQSSSEED